MPIEVIMPDLGAVSKENTLVQWLVEEGQSVSKGAPLFEAESDKATVEIEAAEDGLVARLLAKPGSVILAGEVIAWLLRPDETEADIDNLIPPLEQPAQDTLTESKITAPDRHPKGVHLSDRQLISPRARRLAGECGIDFSSITGTGPLGRIIEADILDAVQTIQDSQATQVLPPQPRIAGVRGRIAQRMFESAQNTAAVTLTTDVNARNLVNLRRALIDEDSDNAPRYSYDLLFAIICAQTLKEHLNVNASFTEKGIVEHDEINIGVAVDTEQGLLVPVLRNVDHNSLLELAVKLADLKQRARNGNLTPDELRGGTFTITNLGAMGIDAFTPIINLPEIAVLGVGRIYERPTVVEKKISIGQMTMLSLTFDHRAIDGGPAARFLQQISILVEQPERLLAKLLESPG